MFMRDIDYFISHQQTKIGLCNQIRFKWASKTKIKIAAAMHNCWLDCDGTVWSAVLLFAFFSRRRVRNLGRMTSDHDLK